MKRIAVALLIFFLVLVAAFFNWRNKAPSYMGQDLHPKVDIGSGTDLSLELLFLGDMGTGDGNQLKIAQAMNNYCKTHRLAAVIFLGDNFYQKGVQSVSDEQWQSKFIKPYGLDCLVNIPFYALLGNHDYKGSPNAQIEYRSSAPSWNMPHRFYDLRFGDLLQLTMIDTTILDICGFSQYCSLDFMLDSLRRSEARFTLVLGHHPVASSSSKYARDFQGGVLESLICDRAHYYLSGHSHHLEHLTSTTCKSALDLFIVGGGGAELYEVKTWKKETRFALSTFGFASMKVDFDKITFAFHDADSKKLYEVVKQKDEEAIKAVLP